MAVKQDLSIKAADILVVDDAIASLRLLTEILTKGGYQVRPAEKPQVALESALAYPPSLILLDVLMPEMSGYEVCARLKQDERTRDIPIIFVSALQDVESKVRGFKAGGADFLSKPFEESEVLARVKRYRSVVEDSPLLICNSEPGGIITFVNNAYCTYVGMDQQELIGKSFFFTIPYEDRDWVAADIAGLTPDAPLQVHEHRAFGLDDQVLWQRWTDRALFDEGGRVISYQSFGEDITERKHAEDALRESEERFRATFEQAAVGIDHEALDGRFLRINQKFCDIVGYSQEEMLERSFQDITHPDDLDIDHEDAQRMLDGQLESYSIEKRYIHKNGEIVWVNITVSLVWEETGSPSYFISVVEDITEQKEVDDALRESEEHFRAIFNQAAVGIARTELDGHFSRINQRFCDIVGYSIEEMQELTFQEITHPEDADADLAVVNQLLTGEVDTYVREKRYIHKEGTIIWVKLSIALLRSETGEPHWFITIMEDITERKRAEEILKADLAFHREDLSVLVQRLSLAVKISSFGIWDWDLKENSMTWDNKLFEIYGIEKKFPLPYEDWVHLIHPDDLPTVEAIMRTVIENKSEAFLDFRIVRPDGELRHISAAGTVVLNVAGEVVKAIGINLDITERTQAEDALQESESLLRAITDNYPAFLSIIMKGEQDLIVDFTTGKEFEKLDLDPDSFVGRTLEKVFGDQAAIVRENYTRAFIGEKVMFELFINDQNQLYNAIPLIDEHGAIDRILVVVENITERKLIEAQREQTAAQAERDRLARELHDAVTQTIFSASVIAEAAPSVWDKDPAIGRQYLEQLPRMLRGALAEMRTLLLELRPGSLVDQTLGQLLELLAEAARARTGANVTLNVEGDRPLPEDATIALHRIAQESLNNVAKHAEASLVNIRFICRPDRCVLQVADDGRGFDPEIIPPGHLGVSIMRERAQEIGATFQIDSKLGEGTLVVVSWSEAIDGK